MIIQFLFIYLIFIYIYDSCFDKILFIKNMFWRTVERATWWVSPGLLRNSIDMREIVLVILWLVPSGVSLWDR